MLREQLVHLAKVAEFANVRFRILPWSAGSSPALGCPFTLLYIKPSRTIAYVASLTRPEYIKATGPYSVGFDQAWELAVSDSDSMEILSERIAELS
ncbi:Putative DNA-binding protein [Alloactinosynnema sp. L-07]|nr:Putative DNA-binding protein [Alloactinosynnema sp. L-07]